MIKCTNDQWDTMIKEFSELYPYLAEKVIDWYPSGQMEITVRILEGEKFAFDFMDKSIRSLGNVNDRGFVDFKIDEEEWRIIFSSKLRTKMMRVCMSQSDLSELTGISMVSMSKYINGKATPSAYNMTLIASALKCSTAELMEVSRYIQI